MRGRLSSGLSDLDRSFFVAFMSGGIGLKGFGGGEIVLLNKVVNSDFLMSIVATAFAFAVLAVVIVVVDDVAADITVAAAILAVAETIVAVLAAAVFPQLVLKCTKKHFPPSDLLDDN